MSHRGCTSADVVLYRPPDQPPSPKESAPETTNEQKQTTDAEATQATPAAEGQAEQNAATDAANEESTNDKTQAPQTVEVEVESSSSVVTNFDLPGHDATNSNSSSAPSVVPRLDGLFVRSAFRELKTADEEIQAGITEAVARQLEAEAQADADPEEDAREVVDPLVAEVLAAGEKDTVVRQSSFEEASVETLVDEPVTPTSDIKAQEVVQAEVDQVVTSEAIEVEIPASETQPTPLADKAVTSETTEAVASNSSSDEVTAPKTTASEPASPQPAAPNKAMPQAAPAAPGIAGMLGNASPDEIAALMAYLQQLQSQKTGGSNETVASQTAPPKASPQESLEPATPEPSIPESPSAEAVARMTEPIEPSRQEPKTQQPEGATSPGPAIPDPTISKNDVPESPKSDNGFAYEAILDAVAPKSEAASGAQAGLEESRASPLGNVTSQSAASVSEAKSTDNIYGLDPFSQEEPEDKTHDLESVLDEELADKASKALASESISAPKVEEEEDREPSRLPRNVQAFYLQPLRRVAQFGVPSCDLQLRSYSVRPLESFCDFALRAAYYLGLPAYGPTPLPKIIERWTVPKSTFIHKKSQENFERITRRRLIQIKDGHPETVQIWLAFLQKHQQAAVGMKANMWEFSSLGKSLCDLLLLRLPLAAREVY